MSAPRDYFSIAFRQMEGPISHAKSQSRVLQILAEVHADEIAKPFGLDGSIVPEAVFFMVTELAKSLGELSAQHLALHNEGPDVRRPRRSPVAVDPLLELIERYRHQCYLYNATDNGEDGHADDTTYKEIVAPLYAKLKDETPQATTDAGAIAALKLALEEQEHSSGGFEWPLVEAALAYLGGRQA